MTNQWLVAIYFLVGIIYCFINGAIRRLDNDDWLLTFIWLIFWPICFLALIVEGIFKLFKK